MASSANVMRTRDAALINRIANSTGVREFIDYRVSPVAPMDFTPACDRPGLTGMVWLTDGDDALACFELSRPREYQAHLFFGRRCRGAQAIAIGRAMMTYLVAWADRLWGAIPLRNSKARWFARRMGFEHCGFGEAPVGVPVEFLERTMV